MCRYSLYIHRGSEAATTNSLHITTVFADVAILWTNSSFTFLKDSRKQKSIACRTTRFHTVCDDRACQCWQGSILSRHDQQEVVYARCGFSSLDSSPAIRDNQDRWVARYRLWISADPTHWIHGLVRSSIVDIFNCGLLTESWRDLYRSGRND